MFANLASVTEQERTLSGLQTCKAEKEILIMSMQTSSSSIPQKHVGRHALVIGGSMSGLLATRILSDYYEQVTIVDRDIFPTTPDHRKGVAQSYHAHALLAAGQSIISELFPGILDIVSLSKGEARGG
jgi:hypothetical protein